MRNWKYRVVKKQLGNQGQWFTYPAAMTTASEEEARKFVAEYRV